MKIFFALAVLIAVAYLAIPSKTIEQFKQYLPQEKIAQAATSLLSKVDEKLNTVKQQLSTQQEKLSTQQEKRLAGLEAKLLQLEERLQQKLTNQPKINKEFYEKTAIIQDKHKQDELVSTKESLTLQQYVTNQRFEDENTNRHKQNINRQLQLQEIAERMNQSSLLALISN